MFILISALVIIKVIDMEPEYTVFFADAVDLNIDKRTAFISHPTFKNPVVPHA